MKTALSLMIGVSLTLATASVNAQADSSQPLGPDDWVQQTGHSDGSRQYVASAGEERIAQAEAPPSKSSRRSGMDDKDRFRGSTLEEIIVTAQKRNERIQDVPASITVLDSQRLSKTEPQSLMDLGGYVPALSVVSGNGTAGQTQLTLRGIATDSIGLGALVGTYVDDVQVGSNSAAVRGSLYSLDLMPYDIERLEVLRGPQGTLYGAGTMGGLLKYVFRSPNLSEFEGRAGATANTISESRGTGSGARAAVNVPIISDRLGFRLSGYRQKTPGYVDDIGLGKRDYNAYTQEGARIAGLWQATENLAIKASAMYQTIDATGSANIPIQRANLQPQYGNFKASSSGAATNEQEAQLYALIVDWNVGFASITNALSWTKLDSSSLSDLTAFFSSTINALTGGASANATAPFILRFELKDKLTEEFRITSPSDGRFKWMVGAFYTDEDSTNDQELLALDASGNGIPNVNPFLYFFLPWKYKEGAVFANGTVDVGHNVDLNFGVRYAKNWQRSETVSYGRSVNGSTTAPAAPDVVRFSEAVSTWMLSPEWHISQTSMLYARVATGYRPGGYSFALNSAVPKTFESDRLVSYELGFKGTFLDDHLSIDAALFSIDWEDVQVNIVDPVTRFSYFGNGGRARSRGGEISAHYTVIDDLRLGATVSNVDAKLRDAAPGIGGLPGDRLPLSPRWSAALTVDYTHQLMNGIGVETGAGYRYSDEVWTSVSSSPGAGLNKQARPVDFYTGIQYGRASARFFVRNAFNSEPSAHALNNRTSASPSRLTLTQPRTIGVSVDVDF